MKRTGSAKKNSKSKGSSTKNGPGKSGAQPRLSRFVVCVKSGGYIDLEPLKVYRVRRDSTATEAGMIRVVDSSGDDYLYPKDFFRAVHVTNRLFEIVKQLAETA